MLIIGLGNPGSEYVSTRHNIGFMIIDEIARIHSFNSYTNKFDGLSSSGTIENQKITLLKPLTYMNLSGKSALKAMSYCKPLLLDQVFVIHDDADIKEFDIKIKKGGGSAGHNGLKSIDASIGKDYWRLRIGIGRPENTDQDLSSFVLSKFKNSEKL